MQNVTSSNTLRNTQTIKTNERNNGARLTQKDRRAKDGDSLKDQDDQKGSLKAAHYKPQLTSKANQERTHPDQMHRPTGISTQPLLPSFHSIRNSSSSSQAILCNAFDVPPHRPVSVARTPPRSRKG